jgi:DNA-binding MarR family transcriptional regulator
MNVEKEIKSTIALGINQEAVINLLINANWINEKSSEFFKQYDISSQQYNVLRILRGKKGKAANLKDIQERMISKMSNTTRLIEKLRIKNYVTRIQCEENRRKIDIHISEAGLSLLETIDKNIGKHENNVVSGLTTEELQVLNKLLNKLRSK